MDIQWTESKVSSSESKLYGFALGENVEHASFLASNLFTDMIFWYSSFSPYLISKDKYVAPQKLKDMSLCAIVLVCVFHPKRQFENSKINCLIIFIFYFLNAW